LPVHAIAVVSIFWWLHRDAFEERRDIARLTAMLRCVSSVDHIARFGFNCRAGRLAENKFVKLFPPIIHAFMHAYF
jgi:hypothetical protein